MALKSIIENLDEVQKEFQGLYVKDDATGHFRLDLEQDPNANKETEELRKERERLKAQNDRLLEEKKKEQEKARAAEEDRARREKDVESLERTWKERHDKEVAEAQQRTNTLMNALESQMVNGVALRIATEISDSPDLMLPHVQSRLRASEENGRWVTRVVDVAGNATAMTVEELAEQLKAEKRYAPLIRGTKAAGGGANGGNGGAGGGANGSGGQQQEKGKGYNFGGDDRLARARQAITGKDWNK